jgi:hypothetical protein
MKTVKDENENIKQVLETGLEKENISQDEMQEALNLTTWEAITPILNKAQGIHADPDNLKQAREKAPLHRSDFTPSELEKLKSLAPEEYELLR